MKFERPHCRSRTPLAPVLAAPCAFARDLVRPRACAPFLLWGPAWAIPVPRLPQSHLLTPRRCQRRTSWRPGAAAAAPCAIPRDILCLAACARCLLWSPTWDFQARQLQPHLLAPGRSQRCTSWRPGAAAAAPCAIARDLFCPAACARCLLAAAAAPPRLAIAC